MRRSFGAARNPSIAPVLFFGTGLPEDHWHDSDERASVDVLLTGAATLALFWGRLDQF